MSTFEADGRLDLLRVDYMRLWLCNALIAMDELERVMPTGDSVSIALGVWLDQAQS